MLGVTQPCVSAVKSLVYTSHKHSDILGSLFLSPLEIWGGCQSLKGSDTPRPSMDQTPYNF